MSDGLLSTDSVTHTPEPWSTYPVGIRSSDGDERLQRSVVSGSREICTVWNDPENPKRKHADAALISAAPDLLEALRKLVEWQDEVKNAVPRIYLDRAQSAIAKAEGRS